MVSLGLPGIPGALQFGCTMGTAPYFSAISPLSLHGSDRLGITRRLAAAWMQETGPKRDGNRPEKETETGQETTGAL